VNSAALPSLSTIYAHLSYSTEKLIEHAGKIFNRTCVFIQTPPGAYLALIGANLAAFEVALTICRVVNCVFCKNASEDESIEQHERQHWSFALLFTAIVGGSVYACSNRLSLPLSSWKVIGVSFATNFIYLCCKTR
jgi:hypothetical protein